MRNMLLLYVLVYMLLMNSGRLDGNFGSSAHASGECVCWVARQDQADLTYSRT